MKRLVKNITPSLWLGLSGSAVSGSCIHQSTGKRHSEEEKKLVAFHALVFLPWCHSSNYSPERKMLPQTCQNQTAFPESCFPLELPQQTAHRDKAGSSSNKEQVCWSPPCHFLYLYPSPLTLQNEDAEQDHRCPSVREIKQLFRVELIQGQRGWGEVSRLGQTKLPRQLTNVCKDVCTKPPCVLRTRHQSGSSSRDGLSLHRLREACQLDSWSLAQVEIGRSCSTPLCSSACTPHYGKTHTACNRHLPLNHSLLNSKGESKSKGLSNSCIMRLKLVP